MLSSNGGVPCLLSPGPFPTWREDFQSIFFKRLVMTTPPFHCPGFLSPHQTY